MSLNTPPPIELTFLSQTAELQNLLKFRERVEDFLSRSPETSMTLYGQADTLLNVECNADNLNKRAEIIKNLNLHVMQVCYEDSDSNALHLRYISCLFPEFFQNPENQKKFSAIKELHMNGLNLEVLPDSIGVFPKVMVLNLAGNKLQQIPNILINFPKLKVINLQDNPLSPDSLKALENYCSDNSITLQTNLSGKSGARYRPK